MHGTSPTQPPTVLIADDQPAFRRLARQFLALLPAQVIECESGSEALLAFDRHQPDWTLLDWSMPEPDGLAVIRTLRPLHPRAGLVLISAHFTPLLEREAEAAGASGCFPKERLLDVLAFLRLAHRVAPAGTSPRQHSRFPGPESTGNPD